MLRAPVPVIAVCAVRTGCGKSATVRWIARRLRSRGLRLAVIRHPMPYGDLEAQAVQRFGTAADLDRAGCSIEEREEYEPHLAAGTIVYAGVDFARILAQASAEADLILWDGGNNDFPFLHPDLLVALVDPLRAGHETTFHPGETVLRMADVVVVSKADTATAAQTASVTEAARIANPGAVIVRAALRISLDQPEKVAGRRVLVVEDGPTITHGGMPHGAGHVAALAAGAAEIVDPRPFAVGDLAEVFGRYPHIGPVLPALGYGAHQLEALERTIACAPVETVLSATPIDLARLIRIPHPVARITYELVEVGEPSLGSILEAFLEKLGWGSAEQGPCS